MSDLPRCLPTPIHSGFGEYTNDYGRTLMIDIEVQLKSYLYRDGVMMFGGGSLSGETRQRVVEVMRVELLKRFWRYLGAI